MTARSSSSDGRDVRPGFLTVLTGVLALTASLAGPGRAYAQAPSPSPTPAPPVVAGYVVIDLTASAKDATQIVSFPFKTASSSTATIDCKALPAPGPAAAFIVGDLKRLVECATDAGGSIDERARAASHVKQVAKQFAKNGTPRLITDKADVVNVVVVDRAQAYFDKDEKQVPFLLRGRKPKVTFDEKARETQFVSDLKSLARVGAGIFGKEAGGPGFEIVKVEPRDWVHFSPHALRLKRATVTVAAEQGKADTTLKAPAALSEEEAVHLVEKWDATQVKGIRCAADGTAESPKLQSTPLAVLVCRASTIPGPVPSPVPNPAAAAEAAAAAAAARSAQLDLQVTAVEGLGTLGDSRAAPVLTKLVTDATAPAAPGSTLTQPERARITNAALAALSKLEPPAPVAAVAPEEPVKPKAELLTGPFEHWFLSADVPLNSVEALTFDEDTDQVSLGDEPSTFYIGVNFLVGDVKETNRSFFQNFLVKGMIKASKHPLDSVGVGIGLRGQLFKKWGLDLDALTPFVAVTWTVQDAGTGDEVQRRVSRNSELRFGVSLNLDQAVKWVGGS